MLQHIEGTGIAKKQGFIGGNGVNDFSFYYFGGVSFGFVVQITVRGTAVFFNEAIQSGFQKISFALIQKNTGYVVYIFNDDLKFIGSELFHLLFVTFYLSLVICLPR